MMIDKLNGIREKWEQIKRERILNSDITKDMLQDYKEKNPKADRLKYMDEYIDETKRIMEQDLTKIISFQDEKTEGMEEELRVLTDELININDRYDKHINKIKTLKEAIGMTIESEDSEEELPSYFSEDNNEVTPFKDEWTPEPEKRDDDE